MLKSVLASVLVLGGLSAASAQAASLTEGRSTYVHHHYHAAHHYHMIYGRHHGASYGVGSHPPRTTATGGNPGGYSNRN